MIKTLQLLIIITVSSLLVNTQPSQNTIDNLSSSQQSVTTSDSVTSINIVNVIIAALSTISAIVLAFLTAKYVKLNTLMLREMQNNWLPIIFLDFEIREGYTAIIVLGNKGKSPARNIRFSISTNIHWERNFYQGDANFPNINYLPPDRSIELRIGFINLSKMKLENELITIQYSWETTDGSKYSDIASFPLAAFKLKLFATGSRQLTEIAHSVDRIAGYLNPNSITNAAERHLKNLNKTVLCPFCQEEISEHADKCPKCLEWLRKKKLKKAKWGNKWL